MATSVSDAQGQPVAATSSAVAPAAPSPAPPAAQQQAQQRQGMRPAVVLGTAAALVGGLAAMLVPFVTPGMLRSFGVPFNPTETHKLQAMLRHLPPVRSVTQRQQRDAGAGRIARRTLVDLGSGDGRIVVAAAQQGHHAIGYEFNPWLVLYSRVAALTSGVSPLFGLRKVAGGGSARFVCGNMWSAPISSASWCDFD